MPKWEIAIAVCDEPETYRKKEGDIIAFKPAPWQWGKKELDQYLIITVDGMTQEDMVKLCFPLYKNGETNEDTIINNNMKPVGKRKYKLPLNVIKNGWMPTLDTQKVRDPALVYQPLQENRVIIDTSEKVAIFLDKFTETYKHSTKKVA